MIYRIRHTTTYHYEDLVSVSHHIVRLTPHDDSNQRCLEGMITVAPAPASQSRHVDYFGNVATCFTLLEPHEQMVVEAISQMEVDAPPLPDFGASPAWEIVRDTLPRDCSEEGLDAYQFVFDSTRIAALPELRAYAAESFAPGRPVLEAALDLTHRINRDFWFDTSATEVSTPVDTFFEKRRGVCQDFAHLQIACLRSLGLAARYVSGYLRTEPPPGQPRLVGADASHAWCAVYSPGVGWIDFDPTNNCVPADGHVTVAWGRDYTDVSPVHGVLLGGARHTLETAVDVVPLTE